MNSQSEVFSGPARENLLAAASDAFNTFTNSGVLERIRTRLSHAASELDFDDPDHRSHLENIIRAEIQLRAVEKALFALECDLSVAYSECKEAIK